MSEPTLSDLKMARHHLDGIARSSPFSLRSLRDSQDRLSDFMLRHAEHFFALAEAHAQARQCAECGGRGSYWVITDCDSGYTERCPKCGGTGSRPVQPDTERSET